MDRQTAWDKSSSDSGLDTRQRQFARSPQFGLSFTHVRCWRRTRSV
jgi:hypothetical protein